MSRCKRGPCQLAILEKLKPDLNLRHGILYDVNSEVCTLMCCIFVDHIAYSRIQFQIFMHLHVDMYLFNYLLAHISIHLWRIKSCLVILKAEKQLLVIELKL